MEGWIKMSETLLIVIIICVTVITLSLINKNKK